MSFLDLSIRRTYDSGEPGLDILEEFYVPLLAESVAYDRLAGYFSSSALAVAARGVAGLVSNGGRMRLAISPQLTRADFAQLSKTDAASNDGVLVAALQTGLRSELEDAIARDHVRALGWMLREGLLEIRIVLLDEQPNEAGIFHPKNGIFTDASGNRVAFSGSVNESLRGWNRNIERFSVYRQWREVESDYFDDEMNSFLRYWDGTTPAARTLTLPDAIAQELVDDAPDDFEELTLPKRYASGIDSNNTSETPTSRLRWYQKEAVQSWVDAGRIGLFEMATGTGKTRTAIECIRLAGEDLRPLVVNVTVPYAHLVPQWETEIRGQLPRARVISAGGGNSGWRRDILEATKRHMMRLDDLTVIVSVHATASSEDFVEGVKRLASVSASAMLVADEVHALGAAKARTALDEMYELRLGLSATPDRWFDDDGTAVLHDYFGAAPVYEFGLERALHEGFLTPYDYHPYFISLDSEEIEEYRELTRKAIRSKGRQSDESGRGAEEMYLFMRAAVVKKANAKFRVLRSILRELGPELDHTIIYCMDTEQLQLVSEILDEMDLTYRHFTGAEPHASRSGILRSFEEGRVAVLAAMKCLDEGVDVVQARTGIILASSTNPREFIQRRGRLLRLAEGKDSADIYDVVVRPSLDRIDDEVVRSMELRLFQKELARLEEFARLASNSGDCYAQVLEEVRLLAG
ncbi:MAG TPA: DEAD/DEAH box helicase family protein [Coriobacteriia bacterium]|nr:DEAD/DEAH box helicase family protein [Coriobacteriia bacterium]